MRRGERERRGRGRGERRKRRDGRRNESGKRKNEERKVESHSMANAWNVYAIKCKLFIVMK